MRGALRKLGAMLRRPWLLLMAALVVLAAVSATAQPREPVWAGALRYAARQVPGLELEGLSGSLTRPEAARVTLSDARGVWLTLDRVRLVLDSSALLRARLEIESLTAEQATLAYLPESPPPPPGAPPPPSGGPLIQVPDLPITVRVDRLAVDRMQIEEPVLGVPAALAFEGRLALASGALDAAMAMRRLDAPGEFDLRLALNPPADRLEAELRLRDQPGGLVPRALGLPDRPAEVDLTLAGPATVGARLDLRAAVGPDVSLTTGGMLRAQADGALGASLEGEVAAAPLLPPALVPLLGGTAPTRFTFDGDLSAAQQLTLRRLALDAAAGRVEADGTADLAAGSAALRLGFTVAGSEPFAALLAPLDVAWQAARGEARVEGPFAGPRITLDAAMQGFAAPGIPGLAEALGPEPRLHLAATLPETLQELSLTGANARLEGSGRIAEPLDLRVGLTLAGSDPFGALLPIEVSWRALRAEAHATGEIARLGVTLEAAAEDFGSAVAPLAAALGPAPRLRLVAQLPGTVETLRLEGAATAFEASGQVGDTLDARFTAEMQDLAALLGPDFAGAVRAAGTVTGPLADLRLTLEVSGDDALLLAGQRLEAPRLEAQVESAATAPRIGATLAARFAELPLRLLLRGGQAPDARFRLDAAEASFGPARARAEGVLDPASGLFEGTARLDAPDLAPFAGLAGDPSLAGRLSLAAQLAPRPAPSGQGGPGQQGFDARLEAAALRIAGMAAEARLTANGTAAAMDLATQAQLAGVNLTARGRLDASAETGERRLDLAAIEIRQGDQALRLAAQPARVVLRADGGVVLATPLALTAGRGGTIRVTGRWGPDQADLRATLATVPVGLLAALAAAGEEGQLPPMQGTLSGELRASGAVARPEVAANLRATGLRATTSWGGDLPPAELRAQATLAADGAAQLTAEARAGAASLAAEARLRDAFGADAPITATLRGNVDLGQLLSPFLAAGADRAAGRLALDLRAEGTAAAPRLSGSATLTRGEYRNLLYGVRLSNIGATLRADGTRLVLERLDAATPGGGRITASGALDFGAPGMPVEARINARNARPLASDQYRVLLGAELGLDGALAEAVRLSGVVRVGRAEIRLPEALPTRIQTLEVREIGGPPPGTVRARLAARTASRNGRENGASAEAGNSVGGPTIALAIVLEAPREVFVRGRGLDAELGGRLEIGGTVAEPQVAGELRLQRGTLQVLTRRLDIARGTLTFGGGTLLPQLDFLATARTRDTTLRVAVQGTTEAPVITFSSSPELPQDEVAARLLFGRSTGNLSPFEIVQLADALAGATGFGPAGGGSGGLLDRVRHALGLDRLAIGSEEADGDRGRSGGRAAGAADGGASTPTLEAGSYVAEGVYVGIREGTDVSAAPRVAVEIEITPRLRLEAETGGRSGGSSAESGSRVGLSYELEY
ncbi:MAG: translocation/assembly module TamB domain-containing protein [Acetobacteraceae bacterium]|nr:translocation/assembly module TamB domain-containing protein [Acetobacteraceae bacterium]